MQLVGGEGVNGQTEEQGTITLKMATGVFPEILRNSSILHILFQKTEVIH
jgi:hypothetical protein